MAAPEIDSTEGIKVGGVLINSGEVDGRDVSVDGATLDGLVGGFELVDDTTPQLGGALDINGHAIDGVSGVDIGNVLIHAGDVDGRDVSVDGTKLDGIEADATKYPDTGEQAFLDADHTKLDGIATGAIANVSEDTTPHLGGDLDLADYDILVDTSPDANVTSSGIKGTFTNGNSGSVSFGDVCYMAADGHLEFADADATATMPALYMALGTIAAAASGEWLIMGISRHDDWAWTVGAGTSGLIYVSTTGTTGNTLTQTAPSGSGDQVQIVGHAISADVMMFNPDYTYVEIA